MMSDVSAYHEAGHAFMALYLGGRVRSITIEPEWDDGPQRYADIQVEWPVANLSRRQLRQVAVQVVLAGPVAEMIHTGEPYHPGFVAEWSADWRAAWEDAAELVPEETARLAFLERIAVRIYHRLAEDQHWAALAAIVDELLAHETLDGDQVQAAYEQWMS